MFLVLDFTKTPCLAIMHNDSFIIKQLKPKKNISEMLIFEIDKFFNKNNKNIKKLKSVFIITGPGSFTGIRTALTFAKILRLTLTLNLNIFGLSKFDFLNLCTRNTLRERKDIFLHFRGNQFFYQPYAKDKPIGTSRLIAIDKEIIYNERISYISDNSILIDFIGVKNHKKMEENLHFVDYNLTKLPEIISDNLIENSNLRPIYISNYY